MPCMAASKTAIPSSIILDWRNISGAESRMSLSAMTTMTTAPILVLTQTPTPILTPILTRTQIPTRTQILIRTQTPILMALSLR